MHNKNISGLPEFYGKKKIVIIHYDIQYSSISTWHLHASHLRNFTRHSWIACKQCIHVLCYMLYRTRAIVFYNFMSRHYRILLMHSVQSTYKRPKHSNHIQHYSMSINIAKAANYWVPVLVLISVVSLCHNVSLIAKKQEPQDVAWY